MVRQSKGLFIGIGVLFLTVLACQLGSPPPPTTTGNDIAMTATPVVQTFPIPTASASAGATSSLQATPSATNIPPEPTTVAPTRTPTITLSPSPGVPMVSVTRGTNCRSGPGQAYEIITGAQEDVKFLLVGRSTPTDYWIIRLPDGRECWLWGRYAVVEGDIGALPEYAIPATPLPAVGSVAGVITNNVGEPLSNVQVTVQLAGRTQTTGGNGRYSFDNLPTGQDYITVESSDYNPEFRSVNVTKGASLKEDFVLVFFVPGGSLAKVEGRVLLESNPAVGADVWVWSKDSRGTTDQAGRYRINLTSGKFLILAELKNMRGAVDVSIPFDPSKTTTVTAPDIILLPR